MLKLDVHGMTWDEARDAFVTAYNKQMKAKVREGLDMVHGHGSTGVGGVIRTRLRAFLRQHQGYLSFTEGESLDGNPGHTVIHPQLPFPELVDQLTEDILKYCGQPRSHEELLGRFLGRGQARVTQTLQRLTQRQALMTWKEGKRKLYQISPSR